MYVYGVIGFFMAFSRLFVQCKLLLISFQGKECAHLATDSSLIIVCVCAFADLAHCVASTAVQCTFLWLLRFTLFMLTKFAS